MRDLTRREALVAAGSVATVGGLAAVGGWFAGEPASGASDGGGTDGEIVDGETDEAYPLVTYNDHGGPFAPTMPVNVRFDLSEAAADAGVGTVEDVLRASPEWTRLLWTLDAYWPFWNIDRPRAWDRTAGALVRPVVSYRSVVSVGGPTVGYHAHLWPVRVEGRLVGVAASAHTDVGTVRDHLGARYDEAADRLSAPFEAAGWEREPATFEFGVGDDQLSHWGPTGDRWLRPPGA